MIILHAAVEQFATAVDEEICQFDSAFTNLAPDHRLSLAVETIASRYPDFVTNRRERRTLIMSPGTKLFLREHPDAPLPKRQILRRRMPVSRRKVGIIEKYILAVTRFPSADFGKIARYVKKTLRPACNGVLVVSDWDEDGRLQFLVSEEGAAKFGELAWSEWWSSIGIHRIGTGRSKLKPFVIRFDYGPRA